MDLVQPEVEVPRTLWSTKVHLSSAMVPKQHVLTGCDNKITNASLQDHAAALGTGLLCLTQLQLQASTVLILLNDCIGQLNLMNQC